jgi:hypothetical protein
MLHNNVKFYIYIFICILAGCASPLNTDTVSFLVPSSHENHKNIEGLHIAVVPVDTKEKSDETFGTDLKAAGILPIHLIVQNDGTKEFEINHEQIFGVANDVYTVAYTLNKAANHVRSSSIGTTAVAGAITGMVAGAAIGAGIGAGVGSTSDDTSQGAASGAIIGGTVGTASGVGAGLSDSFTAQFKRELANLAFEDRVIYPGDIQQGFIYLKWNPYNKIRVKVFDITENKIHDLMFDISLLR